MLATAESCTGGWVGQLLTSLPGSSAWYERGFITYANAAKVEMLGVPAETIDTYGAVSEETATAMAAGALRNSHAQATLRGNRDQGDGADFRGHKGQASRPPGDFSASQEKVVGGFFFSAEVEADKNQQPEKRQNHRVIRPGQTAAADKKSLDIHQGPNYRIEKLFAWLK